MKKLLLAVVLVTVAVTNGRAGLWTGNGWQLPVSLSKWLPFDFNVTQNGDGSGSWTLTILPRYNRFQTKADKNHPTTKIKREADKMADSSNSSSGGRVFFNTAQWQLGLTSGAYLTLGALTGLIILVYITLDKTLEYRAEHGQLAWRPNETDILPPGSIPPGWNPPLPAGFDDPALPARPPPKVGDLLKGVEQVMALNLGSNMAAVQDGVDVMKGWAKLFGLRNLKKVLRPDAMDSKWKNKKKKNNKEQEEQQELQYGYPAPPPTAPYYPAPNYDAPPPVAPRMPQEAPPQSWAPPPPSWAPPPAPTSAPAPPPPVWAPPPAPTSAPAPSSPSWAPPPPGWAPPPAPTSAPAPPPAPTSAWAPPPPSWAPPPPPPAPESAPAPSLAPTSAPAPPPPAWAPPPASGSAPTPPPPPPAWTPPPVPTPSAAGSRPSFIQSSDFLPIIPSQADPLPFEPSPPFDSGRTQPDNSVLFGRPPPPSPSPPPPSRSSRRDPNSTVPSAPEASAPEATTTTTSAITESTVVLPAEEIHTPTPVAMVTTPAGNYSGHTGINPP